MIGVRMERPDDIPAIRRVNEQAFKSSVEADLIDVLRRNCPDALSLVAEIDGSVVGHIFFTPAAAQKESGAIQGMGLAPMAVQPERQGQGIGGALVRRGLDILRERLCPFAVVLGHPEYYPRFGFKPALERGLRAQWEGIPDEAFMTVVFDKDKMKNVSGTVFYRNEFNQAAQ